MPSQVNLRDAFAAAQRDGDRLAAAPQLFRPRPRIARTLLGVLALLALAAVVQAILRDPPINEASRHAVAPPTKVPRADAPSEGRAVDSREAIPKPVDAGHSLTLPTIKPRSNT